ncbi:MAG TPA: extracellular solute-binding protein [Gaiellaceae bacterium]|jgi:N,N'-diacetylchitobiose transport system substrate-binding protein|nr:extracellular solute-binding protein [Gaiellaceae bacterium]
MRTRVFVAAVAAVALGVVAATASASGQQRQASKLTVWLQVDAQSGWPDAVAAANAQFIKDHPGYTVDVQYQSWGDHLQKFDATLAGGNSPDVIEMGNTEMTKYMAAGAFSDLTSLKGSFDNSGNWLKGLAASGVFGGHLFGVPYYAGSRVVTYRTDVFNKAGIKKLPASLAQFTADTSKLAAANKGVKGFSPVYFAGTDWYFAMSFVYDYGGSIARTHAGQWYGNLDSPQSVAGLTAWKNFFTAASKASKTSDEAHPAPYDVFAQGGAGAIIGPGWYSCCVGTKYKATTAQFVMPSHTAGQPMPGFLGGSDLAVPKGANTALGADWIKDFTSTAGEKLLQSKGNIPNATSLLGTSVNERAAARSWFVPAAKHWVDVENGNILRNMLATILQGKLTVKQAAANASSNIALVLNGS